MTPATERPDAPSCARNREPILAVLQDHFADRRRVLEIGSGTGQHAIYFAGHFPGLTWQTSDRPDQLPGIAAWLDHAALANTPPPIAFDVGAAWPAGPYDAVFSANTLHIMPWAAVEQLFAGLPRILAGGAKLVVYGPFNDGGRCTSDSNAAFDRWLKAQAPHQGLRDFAAVDALARAAGLALVDDRAMPSNNRCLIWQGP